MRRKWLIIGGIILALILAGVFIIKPLIFDKKVETAKVERGSVAQELVLSGEVKAEHDASLKFPIAGKISWIGVTEGKEVYKGQVLVKLDTTNLNSALQRARSDLRAAQASVDKVHDDVKNHSTDETFTQKDTRTTYEVAKDKAYEAVIQAEDNLRNATLYAPFRGIVSYLAEVFSGVNVTAADKIIEIVDLGTIYFEVSADQNEVVNLYSGMKVDIVLDPFSNKELAGEVTYISTTPKEGEAGAVYEVKVKITGQKPDDSKLRIGMTGDARFIISEKQDVLYAPAGFVKSDTKGKYVSKSAKNNKTYIETGIEGEDRVEIKGDIKAGDILYD